MRRQLAIALIAPLLAAALWGHAPAGQEVTLHERLLAEKSIALTPEGLRSFLGDLHPSEELRRRVEVLVKQLGAGEFRVREQAMAQLEGLPIPPIEQLRGAANSEDPEVRWRAQKLLAIVQGESDQLLFAALKTIQQREIAGLSDELLAALPVCRTVQLRMAAEQALAATATEKDKELLVGAVDSERPEVRAAALLALESLLGKEIVAVATKKLLDDDARVRLTAARALANQGDRNALGALVNLLEDENVLIRAQAALTLRQLTGEGFQFAAYDSAERRSAAAAKWKQWLAASGAIAKLNAPLKPLSAGRGYLHGNTLLAFGHRDRVVEYDPSGKEIFSWTGKHTWSAEKLPNGNILVASYGENRVVELSMTGEVVWEHECQTPLNARPLPNGNVLIPEHTKNSVVEVTREHKIVWSYKMSGLTCDGHRLPNGNTLVAGGAMVQEVTPENGVVWEYRSTLPYGIEPLPGGNVIVCDLTTNKVFEVTREKKILWTLDEPRPADAFRLPNGNTLITSSNRFFEITPDLKVIWEQDGCRYGTARR